MTANGSPIHPTQLQETGPLTAPSDTHLVGVAIKCATAAEIECSAALVGARTIQSLTWFRARKIRGWWVLKTRGAQGRTLKGKSFWLVFGTIQFDVLGR
jgi:hypothetical protein